MNVELPDYTPKPTPSEKALESSLKIPASFEHEAGNDARPIDQENIDMSTELQEIMSIVHNLHTLLQNINPTNDIHKTIMEVSDAIYSIDILMEKLKEKNDEEKSYYQDFYDIISNQLPPLDASEAEKKKYYTQAKETFKNLRKKFQEIETERKAILKMLNLKSITKKLGEANIKILKDKLDRLHVLIDNRWKN